jgi:hypothetical protein
VCVTCRGKGITPRLVEPREIAPYSDMVFAFWAYRDGFLHDAGGRLDQVALFIEAIDVLKLELSEIEAEIQEENERKSGRA